MGVAWPVWVRTGRVEYSDEGTAMRYLMGTRRPTECPSCTGTGWHRNEYETQDGRRLVFETQVKCMTCRGRGWL